jgi:hypothetical protein
VTERERIGTSEGFHILVSDLYFSLEKPRSRWKNNIKIHLIGREDVDCIYLAQDRFQGRDVLKMKNNLHYP